MPKSRPPYPAAFRQQMVELVRSGRTPGELAREFEPSAEAIRNWVAQADRDAGKRSDGLRTEEHEEIRRLRRAEPIWKTRASVSRICRRRVYIDGPVAAATEALFDSLPAQRATLCGLVVRHVIICG